MVRAQQHAETAGPPQFAKPILQYTKTRQEALGIRQALTLYLKAQIEFAGDSSGSHISLCAPHNATNVKRVPPELNNGLRAQYLKALQANLVAKREYNSVLQEIASRKQDIHSPASAGGEGLEEKGAEFQTYLGLLRSRREHGKIQIFQHYLEELNKMDAGQAGYLGLAKEQATSRQAAQNLMVHANPASGSAGGNGSDVETLLNNLERAVLRAKSQADVEKRLLEKLKSQHLAEDVKSVPTSKKLGALRRTHAELVRWVEEKLVMSSSIDEQGPVEDQTAIDASDAENIRVLEETKSLIQEQYTAYVNARKALLSVVSTASQPLPAGPQTPQRRLQPRENQQNTATPDLTLLFPYVSENLLPLSKAQKAPSMQKSYLSAILAKEKWTTCRMLDRLQEESHLLPEYPILGRQPRFKNAVAAINRRSPPLASQANPNEVSEIVTRAEAWSFAGREAQGATKGYIEDRINFGTELAEKAEDTLKEIYELMNQDYEEATATKEDKKEGESDIWTSESRYARGRGGRHGRLEKRPKGPWSGLNGRVGVIGDG
ncbi:hypothetical protein RJZ56_002402 [Blastomyces dermatitidis]|uniref:Uncharacterized protein n=3 Tax=Blastomyces TaxID=229219 RepID=A0A179UMQ0_BLAGS|nr:uncharacterized protein BDBG_04429 [Blastomyces gilchristii SLH14081]XP_045272725.1 uncharacterized protein BDCG_08108 [Blastomyces dermatitidis ER-3]EEQ84839.1 hypothetical protein BDCG_08108 [Blastomyces dermatitidis ER-3]EGE84650.1 hypothetical protein BDDG_07595 [Blastomyces dermatitidis ATCC 18188]OAT08488.1 hypothetical protein BDBG_04429 [Blastomyces gilchristii SLH14081]